MIFFFGNCVQLVESLKIKICKLLEVWKLKFGSYWKLKVENESWKLEVEVWKLKMEVGSWKWKLKVGSGSYWKLEVGIWNLKFKIWNLKFEIEIKKKLEKKLKKIGIKIIVHN